MMEKIRKKVWDPKIEKQIRKKWEREKIFKFNVKNEKRIFSIDTPPPYPRPN